MTEYTDKQLGYVLINSDYDRRLTVSNLRDILDALPEPQDEWQPCRFEDIRKGDRVRMAQAGRTTDFHLPVTEAHPTYLVFQGGTQCSYFQKANYYRIPAPVQHPDPEKHPVIIVHESNPAVYDYPLEMMWDGGNCYESPEGALLVKSITRFTPAKVVPEDD